MKEEQYALVHTSLSECSTSPLNSTGDSGFSQSFSEKLGRGVKRKGSELPLPDQQATKKHRVNYDTPGDRHRRWKRLIKLSRSYQHKVSKELMIYQYHTTTRHSYGSTNGQPDASPAPWIPASLVSKLLNWIWRRCRLL